MQRRQLLTAAPLAWALAGCQPRPDDMAHIGGSFTGISHERGHLLRDAAAPATPPAASGPVRRVHTLILGAGVAGLAAARALGQRGITDIAVLELEDSPGGNSRGGSVNGIACPLGAHYLPVPGDDAPEVQALLEDLGLRQRVAGRWVYDERHLCHSPQERLYFNGAWQDSLLPVQGVGPATLAQYRRFAAQVNALRQPGSRFAIPALRAPWNATHQTLDSLTFGAWLDQQGLSDPQLRWYLDYCCRDDYGAGLNRVSAWAGLHYFASRHGFHAPSEPGVERDAVLTWPEGNGWLTRRLAQPLGEHLYPGRVVRRISDERHHVSVEAFHIASQTPERWQATQCIVALPVFVAARLVQNPPDWLTQTAAHLQHAPWLVANLHLRAPLRDRPGAAPSWDNLIYASTGLGYVDAQHQNLSPVPGPTVLTYYHALGDTPEGRRHLLERPWSHWRDAILTDLSPPHPDLRALVTHIHLTRYGHAMSIPTPGLMQRLRQLTPAITRVGQPLPVPRAGRLRFAHSDWAGYSVFEEAFARGHAAGSLL